MIRTVVAVGALLFPFVAGAADADVDNAVEAKIDDQRDFELEVGLAARYRPKYEGSDKYILTAYPLFKIHFLRLPNGKKIGGGSNRGFGIRPSFGYRGKREASDAPILTGLGTVDAAYELGAAVSYRWEYARAFVDLRYGFGGYNGFVGETGVDLVYEPTERLTLAAGPRVSFASSDYMQTYFGVTPAQSAASGLPVTTVGSGFKSAGIAGNIRYKLTDRWTAVTGASWWRLIGDAESSPIISGGGAQDQVWAHFGFTYRFGGNMY